MVICDACISILVLIHKAWRSPFWRRGKQCLLNSPSLSHSLVRGRDNKPSLSYLQYNLALTQLCADPGTQRSACSFCWLHRGDYWLSKHSLRPPADPGCHLHSQKGELLGRLMQ